MDEIRQYDPHLDQFGPIWIKRGEPIPNGWGVCDGTKGLPDLRDRYVGASQAMESSPDYFELIPIMPLPINTSRIRMLIDTLIDQIEEELGGLSVRDAKVLGQIFLEFANDILALNSPPDP